MKSSSLHTSRYGENAGRHRRDSLIAAGITFLAALLIFCFLFWGEIGFDRRQMAEASIPELAAEEDEELFLDPELLNLGEEESPRQTEAAAMAQGTPEVVDEPKTEIKTPVVKGDNPKPAPPKEKLVSQSKPSPVKTRAPSATEKEVQKVQSKTAGAFSPDNGHPEGRNNSAGSGGTSTGITGQSNGWTFLGCPSPDVKLRNRTVITVSVTVNASGTVTSAKASGGNPTLRAACEAAARKARWRPLDASKSRAAKGTITFTITPR